MRSKNSYVECCVGKQNRNEHLVLYAGNRTLMMIEFTVGTLQ